MKTPFELIMKPSALLLLLAAVGNAGAQLASHNEHAIANFDVRQAQAVVSPARRQAETRLVNQAPSAVVDYDQLTGAPKFIHAQSGFLTGPNGQGGAVRNPQSVAGLAASDPHLPVKAFLNEHSALFGFGAEALNGAKISRNDVGAHNGLRNTVWQQQINDVPIFEAVLIGNVTKDGELVSLSSGFVNGQSTIGNAQAPAISAQQAIINAAQNLGDTLTLNDLDASEARLGWQVFNRGQARLVWLPMDSATLRLSWEIFLMSQTVHEKFQVLISADTGEVLLRRNVTKHISDATYNVYTSDSPSPFSPGWPTPNAGQPALVNRTMVTIAALSTNASPNGWIDDADNTTTGNNTDAFVDRNFDQQPDGPRPVGNPNRVFDFPLDLTNNPLVYSNASTVQMFYWVNWYHDKVYDLGFTESAGNYQQDNFGRGGLGNDRIIAYIQAGADVGQSDNAFFSPAPDGFNGQIAMFTWSGPNPDRDGDLDADVILHEATHGTSERLVGGGVLISALQTGGMGEGWSDFYALSLMSQPGDDPDAVYAAGGYASFLLGGLNQNYYFGIRHYPYCTDMLKNPFTFKDIDRTQVIPHTGVPLSPIYPFNVLEADEVHHQGEIWCTTLWEVRANLIHKYGSGGNQIMLQLVTDGMKLGPANPTMLQARDAIILADQVNNGSANFVDIWRGFAKRGMGVSATSPDSSTTIGVHEAFDLPGVQIVSTNLPGGNGNGTVDPNECNPLYVTLRNLGAIGVTGISATLTTTNANVIVTARQSPYPNLPSGSSASNTVAFQFSTSQNFICGTIINFTLVLKSDQFTQTNFFSLPSGSLGTPVQYNSTAPVPIPDLSSGDSSLLVTNFNSTVLKATVGIFVTHTYDSDLLLQLISPDGVTNVLAANVGGSGDNFGSGCSSGSQTTFDDDAAVGISSGAAPFVGSFKPAQRLSVYIGRTGTNVNGVWHLHAVDQVGLDSGTIQCWSLSLTPPTCTDGGGECPGSDLSIGGSSAPEPVIIGNNLVYTISLTNRGPKFAKGVTFTQLLPASVIFVSANISQGSISPSGGSVNANIGNLPPGSVVTATVTVQPTQAGVLSSTVSAAAVSDPDPDPSNSSVTITSHVSPPTSDMAVSMSATPNPVLVGGTLIYTVNVTNNGPSAASGIVVSNNLPMTAAVVGASASQGSTLIIGNTVLFTLGSLNPGGVATATISVIPTAQGVITATASVTANQFDPVLANNSASAAISVSPAADLAVGFVGVPGAIVLGNNVTYTVRATNLGPSTASSVLISQTLPTNAIFIIASSDLGTVSHTGNQVSCDLGSTTLPLNGIVTMTVTVGFATASTNVSSVSASGALADPVPANNSASVTTVVREPFVSVQPSSSTLTAESFVPPNGSIEPGEVVTLQLRVANAGNIQTTNLMAKLLAGGGVTSPGAATQVYGAILPGAVSVSKPFSFTASGTNGGSVVVTLQLSGDVSNTVSFTFGLPKVASFVNTNTIVIPEEGASAPYPSTILVSGVTGLVGRVTATLSNFNHTFPHDVSVLLVSPSGASTLLISHAANMSDVAGADVTFDDSAALAIPHNGSISSGSWQPSAYPPAPAFPTNAPPATNPPAGPYNATMSVFNGSDPNGTWSLFVMDDSAGDQGGISNGWSLAITTVTPVNNVADVAVSGVGAPNPVLAGANWTNTFTIVNNGTNTASAVMFTNLLPSNVNLLSANISQGTILSTTDGKIIVSIGNMNVGASALVTVAMTPTTSGTLSSTGLVSAAEADLALANNIAVISTTANLPVADLSVAAVGNLSTVVNGSNLVYSITVSNAGPQNAINVVVTDPLPAALAFVSSVPNTNSSGPLTWNLGTLAPGASVVITMNARAVSVSTITNTISVATGSSDSNSANNSANVATVIRAPAPNIVVVGVKLLSESFSPADGAVDPGEAVSVSLTLANIGEVDTSGLVVGLQNTGGVTGASAAQGYGTVVHNGSGVTRTYNFTASSSAAGNVIATWDLVDGVTTLGTVSFTFNLPQTNSYANTNSIVIPNQGPASPYPSTINISGLTGTVSKVVVSLNGLKHSFPHDVGMLLVSPSGAKAMVMSGVGGGNSISNVNLTFDDSAASSLSELGQIISGTYKPTAYLPGKTFPSLVVAGTTNSFVPFRGGTPNGTWALYVVDDASGDSGIITGGWSLTLTTVSTVNPIADVAIIASGVSPNPAYTGVPVTYTFIVSNKGPASVTGVVISNTLPNGSLVVSNLAALTVGETATISFVTVPSFSGPALDTASVSANETDLNSADNSASSSVTVLNLVPPQLSGDIIKANNQFELTLKGQPNLAYIIQGSTNLTSWTSISTNVADSTGTIVFTDTSSSGLKQRFYRAIAAP
jgi:uncharacterized repeat protein (TIGR01451 family)